MKKFDLEEAWNTLMPVIAISTIIMATIAVVELLLIAWKAENYWALGAASFLGAVFLYGGLKK